MGSKHIHRCDGCGSAIATDYTEPLGHSWDKGTLVTNATCTGEGVMEYHCVRCGEHKIEGNAAAGHIPGSAATCTEPQLCTKCGAVLNKALGHDYKTEITKPTCTEMGYTMMTCTRCGDSTKTIIPRQPVTSRVTGSSTSSLLRTPKAASTRSVLSVAEKLDTQPIEKIYNSGTTDSKGQAVVGGYLVTVTDTEDKTPVSNASVVLNKDNSISIRLPNSRLLDYDDQTTVLVQLVKDKSAVQGMRIAVTDKNDNYAADQTDKTGQITVPIGNGKTNEDGKVTEGYEDADRDRWTLTIKVVHTDTGRPIQGSEVSIGKTGNITVELPKGVDMDGKHQVTVIVTDPKKVPQKNINVIVKNDLGDKATGKTDKNGEVTGSRSRENGTSQRLCRWLYGRYVRTGTQHDPKRSSGDFCTTAGR